MTITVGNLLTNAAAQSFISIADADGYLAPEQRQTWDLASSTAREAALVSASRWLASSITWRDGLVPADLARIGQVAARLAVDALDMNLFEADQIGKTKRRVKAGSVEVEFAEDRRTSQAAGRRWPWLLPMLSGLTAARGASLPVVRV